MKHTVKFMYQWLKVNGYTFNDLVRAYRRNTGVIVTAGDIIKDSTTTWRYYLEVV